MKIAPFETDTIIASGIARKLAESVEDTIPITVLPTEPVGYSIEHMDYEGSQTLSYDEAIDRWINIFQINIYITFFLVFFRFIAVKNDFDPSFFTFAFGI